MSYWWDGDNAERAWVEIRWAEGIGTELRCPQRDMIGDRNAWWDLVTQVRPRDLVYHYHPHERRIVGRSEVVSAYKIDPETNERIVALRNFTPVLGGTLDDLRGHQRRITAEKMRLTREHPHEKLYLPFQWRSDGLRFISNYFAKWPRAYAALVFGPDGLGGFSGRSTPGENKARASGHTESHGSRRGFLQPFKPKADTAYRAQISGTEQLRTRDHETLVNNCAEWITRTYGHQTGRNAAIDLGTSTPPVVIEAKIASGSWSLIIREAVGQLYEYRYFQLVSKRSSLVFLADRQPPAHWIRYLESDRKIGVLWASGKTFKASRLAERALARKR